MKAYKNLAIAISVHFFIMYALTYVAVYAWSDVSLFSTRSLYMTLVMVAPMVLVMLVFMHGMYTNKKVNKFLYVCSLGVFFVSLFFIREQVFVKDVQFLQSMIPHHSSAITMCKKSTLSDPEVIELCEGIIKSQQKEIDQMKAILERL